MLLAGSYGREQSIPEAVKLLKRAQKLPGATDAFLQLGNLSAQGIGVPRDGAMAIAYFREGAANGSLPCLLGLHRLFREGTLVERNLPEAEKLGQEAAEGGNSEACFQLGIFYEKFCEGAPKWEQAFEWLDKASQGGNAGASTRLGSYFYNGKLPEGKNQEKSLEYLRRAADQDDAEACFLISQFYQNGTVVAKDLVASTAWLRIGAGRGHIPSANELGLRLLAGIGIWQSSTEAAEWFLRAANAGMPAARVNLSEMLMYGVGVRRDPIKAMALLESAAKANHAGAQQRLAILLAKGAATGQPDPVGAAYWGVRFSAKNKEGTELAKQLRENLNKSQEGELARRLQAYLEKLKKSPR